MLIIKLWLVTLPPIRKKVPNRKISVDESYFEPIDKTYCKKDVVAPKYQTLGGDRDDWRVVTQRWRQS